MSGLSRVPIMTDATTPAPLVASASTDSTNAFKVFDQADSQWVATATTGTHKLDFGSQRWAVDQYTIEPQSTTRAPSEWTFEGSQDDSAWVTLDTRTGQTTWSTGVKVTYHCGNKTKFRYYRLVITANNGDGTNLEIDEVQYFAPDAASYATFL